jgi:hypothetical protein
MYAANTQKYKEKRKECVKICKTLEKNEQESVKNLNMLLLVAILDNLVCLFKLASKSNS